MGMGAFSGGGTKVISECSTSCGGRLTSQAGGPIRLLSVCDRHVIGWDKTGTIIYFEWRWIGNGRCHRFVNGAETAVAAFTNENSSNKLKVKNAKISGNPRMTLRRMMPSLWAAVLFTYC